VRVSDWVHYTAGVEGGLVLLDARSGRWYVLNSVAADLWHSWSAGYDLDTSAATVAARHTDIPLARINSDARALLSHLTDLGMVQPESAGRSPAPRRSQPSGSAVPSRPRPYPRSATSSSGQPSPPPNPPTRPLGLNLAAAVALLFATILVRLPFRPVSRAVGGTRRWCRRPETITRAELFGSAVRRAAAWSPWRSACMEVSLAVVLLAAMRRRRLDWCLGALPDPYRFHAWVESDGQRVCLPGDPDTGDYVPVLTL
jgi:Transglutaminase-like superfamily/Coenzyme PQQ synthesis protein D (PqqD)